MTYNIDSLYNTWKTDCLSESPTCPLDQLTMDNFINSMIGTFEMMMDDGTDIPDDILFVIDYISKDS